MSMIDGMDADIGMSNMHAVLGFAQVLEHNPKEPLSEKQKSAVDHILRGGNHLLELIDRLLDLSKIEAGELSLEIKHIPARDVIDECLYLIQTRTKHKDIKILDQTVGEDLPLLWTDKTRLKQVLLNLLSNAVKYNCENGTVTLGCQETSKQMLHISVADTGTGIPAEQRDDLFKPFERLGREAGQIEGTGIGLTISRQIIEQLGGEIGFESEEGKGSTFWVDVPLSSKQGSGSEEDQGDGHSHPERHGQERRRPG
jgi:signal transduction histidine kinase